MFLHREHDPAGPLAIPQTSHAWLSWQLAAHWGNRQVARPAPRPEVLAAVFLHDGGWTEFDTDPGIDGDGRPVTFDRMPGTQHLDIWRSSVRRAASYSRYAALLVADHFAAMAQRKTSDLLKREDTAGARAVQAFQAEMERLQASWREGLTVDARYQAYLEGPAWQANVRLLEASDALSVYLCGELGASFSTVVSGPSGEPIEIHFESVGEGEWRARPWPLEGEGLRLHCEGRRLGKARFASADALREALARAPVERLTFSVHRPSAG
jgi:hypothetical protein